MMARQTITVPTIDGPTDVLAFVFGHWAAHEAVRAVIPGVGWTVTHVPTGLRANSHPSIGYCDEERAVRIARQLDADGVTTVETPSHKPRVLLDVDGVLADFVGAYLNLLARELGIFATHEQVTAFDIGASLSLTREQSAQMKRALGNSEQFARWLEVYPGAVEGVARLQDVADVFIVTSPWNSNPTWTFDREHWLREHFNIHHSRVVHTSAKHLCRGDFLVDDKTDTLRSWARENPYGIAVQWKTPHNRQDGWLSRATDSWDELIALVDTRRAP